MKPSWHTCLICNSHGGTAETPQAEPGKTIVEEHAANGLNMPRASPVHKSAEPPGLPPSLENVRGATTRDPGRTIVRGENGAFSPSSKADDGKLKGFLVSFSSNPQGEYFALFSTGRYAIGRSQHADISFPQDSQISESHALLRHTGACFEFQDNMSTNGSYINGERVDQRAALTNYDRLKLGNTELLLILVDPGETEDASCQAS